MSFTTSQNSYIGDPGTIFVIMIGALALILTLVPKCTTFEGGIQTK